MSSTWIRLEVKLSNIKKQGKKHSVSLSISNVWRRKMSCESQPVHPQYALNKRKFRQKKMCALSGIWTHASYDSATWVHPLRPLGHQGLLWRCWKTDESILCFWAQKLQNTVTFHFRRISPVKNVNLIMFFLIWFRLLTSYQPYPRSWSLKDNFLATKENVRRHAIQD